MKSNNNTNNKQNNMKYYILIFLFLLGLAWSGINPKDSFTWILEVFPGILGAIVLALTFWKFRFTYLTYIVILIHCYILFVGGHYTYAEVPLFDWIRDVFHQSRNNYDKVGHFAQGFVPALIVRELLVRLKIIRKTAWVPMFTVSICLSISAIYEFFEWFVAVMSGQSSDAFLGTQGYVWDTQSDMLYATIGAIFMALFISGIQDKFIQKIEPINTN
jgi:putative membrane protein